MKDKKTLNIVLSICISLCALVCTVMAISDLTIGYMIASTGTDITTISGINWRIGGPLIGFASIGGLLALIKIIVCSWSTRKANKALGTVAVICDILVLCGLSMVASAIGVWNGDIGLSKIEKALNAVQVLLIVGAPTMLIGAIGSWVSIKQIAK